MALIDPESSPANEASPAPAVNNPSSVPSVPPSGGMSRLLAFACAAGLIAGVCSMFAGERILSRYQHDLVPAIQAHPTAEDILRFKDARLYSAAITFATMGGILGLAMGLSGGLARQSAFATAGAAILGLLLGAAAGGYTALSLVSAFYKKHDPQSGDLMLPLLTHGAIWSIIGAIGGLAFGLGIGGRGRWKTTVVGGLLGAAAATIVYEIVGALVFPTSKTDLPLSSSSTTRGMAQLLVAIFSAVGTVLSLRRAQ